MTESKYGHLICTELKEEARQKEREDRKRRAKPYDTFERDWLKKKPSEEALTAFGSWPDGKQTKEIVRI